MNINIILDEEQTDVLAAVVADRNKKLPPGSTPYTTASHLQELILKAVNGYVETAFQETAALLVKASRSKPYSERKVLISDVKVKVGIKDS